MWVLFRKLVDNDEVPQLNDKFQREFALWFAPRESWFTKVQNKDTGAAAREKLQLLFHFFKQSLPIYTKSDNLTNPSDESESSAGSSPKKNLSVLNFPPVLPKSQKFTEINIRFRDLNKLGLEIAPAVVPGEGGKGSPEIDSLQVVSVNRRHILAGVHIKVGQKLVLLSDHSWATPPKPGNKRDYTNFFSYYSNLNWVANVALVENQPGTSIIDGNTWVSLWFGESDSGWICKEILYKIYLNSFFKPFAVRNKFFKVIRNKFFKVRQHEYAPEFSHAEVEVFTKSDISSIPPAAAGESEDS